MTTRLHIASSAKLLRRVVEAARDTSPVIGLTHGYYRYPARFSPQFVRAAIQAFSSPGDLVLDPFVGGGTTLVEAMATGRNAIGADISPLATFVTTVKTTLYSDTELHELECWGKKVETRINMHSSALAFSAYAKAGYHRHLNHPKTWRLRKIISQALMTLGELSSQELQQLARCVLLRTGQWALDGRRKLPSVAEFRNALHRDTRSMIVGALKLRRAVESLHVRDAPVVNCINRSTAGLETDPLLIAWPKPTLVITSPPYPGVHVLYHRWQVDGRKETPAPFWIANKLDGLGAAYYTMGDRHAAELNTYFENLRATLQSISAVCMRETTIVQVVAFAEPDWQLPRYLATAEDAGLAEHFLPNMRLGWDGRLWRAVPNRKWHADQKGSTNSSKEVVLFHRIK